MTGFHRRGACPSLLQPMQTGDGLLARLDTGFRILTLQQFKAILQGALKHGNGLVEITGRGNLQLRGLTTGSANALAVIIGKLGLQSESLPIAIGPLAGIDRDEIANPVPVAANIQNAVSPALRAGLAPKTSIVVDGGGQLSIDNIGADIRLSAIADSGSARWHVAVGGDAHTATPVCLVDQPDIVPVVTELLTRIASAGPSARGRDLDHGTIADLIETTVKPRTAHRKTSPVGTFAETNGLTAIGLGLPFGAIDAKKLIGFIEALQAMKIASVRPAPGRALLFTGMDGAAVAKLVEIAGNFGLVTDPGDPRLAISACIGAPRCGSAEIDTRKLAGDISAKAAPLLDGSFTLHISGCAKRCADTAGPKVSIIGQPDGCDLIGEFGPTNGETAKTSAQDLPEHFGTLAKRYRSTQADGADEPPDIFLKNLRAAIFAPKKTEPC